MKLKRSKFDLSRRRKFTCDMGYLIPCFLEEVLPGDSFKVQSDMLVRLSPLIAPIMHEVDIFTHYWFVPNRLIWKDWEEFITRGENGSSVVVAPYYLTKDNDFRSGSLADYLEYPECPKGVKVSPLFVRAYNLIFNEWYRDQNLQEEVPIEFGSGEDRTTSWNLLRRNWKKDYFTSCLPWPQRGPSPNIPLAGQAPVIFPDERFEVSFLNIGHNEPTNKDIYGSYRSGGSYNGNWPLEFGRRVNREDAEVRVANVHSPKDAKVDLSEASGISINKLREFFQIQKWFELSARGGARYIEQLYQHFGVRSSDARLQRPEYLGGGQSPIVISEVLQTSSTDSKSPQGNMSGHGFSLQRSHQFKRFFEEHGIVIGLVSVMPKAAYQQGLSRRYTRFSNFDYFFPTFAHLGEQPVLNKELFVGDVKSLDGVFGYQPQYQEYRTAFDTVHGDFKDTLKYWHMGRIFENLPHLNEDFVKCDPTKRINVITNQHNVYIDMENRVFAKRKVPKYGSPAGLF